MLRSGVMSVRHVFVQLADADLARKECIVYFGALQRRLAEIGGVSYVRIDRPGNTVFIDDAVRLHQFCQNPPRILRPSLPMVIGYLAQALEGLSLASEDSMRGITDWIVLAFVTKDTVVSRHDIDLFKRHASARYRIFLVDSTPTQQSVGKLSSEVYNLTKALGCQGVLLTSPLDRYIR